MAKDTNVLQHCVEGSGVFMLRQSLVAFSRHSRHARQGVFQTYCPTWLGAKRPFLNSTWFLSTEYSTFLQTFLKQIMKIDSKVGLHTITSNN
jgi:hypothetical protein